MASEKGEAEQVKQPIATVDFLHFCNFGFLDAEGRPNLIGVILSLEPDEFPFSCPSIMIVAGLRVPPRTAFRIRIELCTSNGVVQRGAHFNINTEKDYVFLPLQTVALFFRKPEDLIARVVEDEHVLATKTLRILPPISAPK